MNEIMTKSKYNPEAHKKLYYFTIFRRSGSFYFVLLLVLALAGFLIYNTSKVEFNESSIVSYVVVGFTLLFTPLILLTRINSSIKKDAEERKDTFEFIEVNKEKLSRKLEGFPKVVIGWHQVEVVYERKDYFFFFLGGEQTLIIEKDKFEIGDSNILISLIEKYGPKNKKGKPKLKKLKVNKK